MGSKTKIVVLHMKEIIYTTIFAALGILLCSVRGAEMQNPQTGKNTPPVSTLLQ